MSKKLLLFLAVCAGLIAGFLVYQRSGIRLASNAIPHDLDIKTKHWPEHSRDLVRRWCSYPTIPISRKVDLETYLSAIPVTPSSAISPDLDRKLRNTIVELLQILNKGDCPAFVEFQRVRGQQDYDEKYLGNVGKYLRLDASQPIDRLYAQIWKTAYSSGLSGYQSSGFDNMCTTETTLEVFKKPPDLSIAKVIGPREEAATENELGSVGGTLSLRSKVDPETSKAADVALFHAVIRPKDSDPAYPWYFVFEYQPDVGQWVLMSYMTTLTDYKLKYFPFL